jgi:fatty acid desaturase
MKKLLNISILMYIVGIATAGFCQLPWNPISAILISTSICVRWTMVGHHVSHGGYNAQVGPDSRFHRGKFGRGPVRRFVDWLDWMLPEAWDVEHNFMHHYELGEASDPDLVERNTHSIRVSKVPLPIKYLEMFALMTMWKWFYYTPNTLKEMYARQKQLAEKRGETAEQPFNLPKAPGDFGDATKQATIKYAIAEAFSFNFKPTLVLARVMAPYFLAHFVAAPAIFYLLFGPAVALTALANLVLAEVLTNLHSFTIIAPNHAGRDIYRFTTPVKVKSDEFYLRAVIGSTNYRTGGDANDFMHGWLNYQIEHHMFPDMSMLSYQRMAPRIKAICEKHGVPYVQENVFKRLWKVLRIGTGEDSMKVWERGD